MKSAPRCRSAPSRSPAGPLRVEEGDDVGFFGVASDGVDAEFVSHRAALEFGWRLPT